MTNKELQEKFEQLASEMDWIKTKLVDLLEEKGLAPVKTPYEVEVPEDIGDYYFVSELGAITLLKDVFFSAGYEKVYQRGLAFKTKEEAEQFDKKRILINKMEDWAKIHNGDWTPNWSDVYEKKHYITFEKEGEIFDVNWCMCYQQFTKLPYFKSVEVAWKFIDEFGGEIEEVLC